MSFRETVRQEAERKIDARAADAGDLKPEWLTHEICNGHTDGLNEESAEADFWREGTYLAVRREVGSYISKRFAIDETGERTRQPTLPGFDHVQTHYIVKREGDEIAVATENLTGVEIVAIADRMVAASATLAAHADELRRYARSRAEAA